MKIQKLTPPSLSIIATLKITRAGPLCNKNISRDVKERGRLKIAKYNGRQHRRLCRKLCVDTDTNKGKFM